jgi:chromosome segregation ATPase
MQLQAEIEETQGAVAASEMTIDLLRQDVKDMDEAWSQFKQSQSSQEELLQALQKKSQLTETTLSALMSRTDTVEALTEVLLKTLEEIKRSRKSQDNAIQRAATKESLVSIRGRTSSVV